VVNFCPGVDVSDSEHSMGLKVESLNCYDLDSRYKEMYEALLVSRHDCHTKVHFGKYAGDVMQVRTSELQGPVDLLKGGPPCPPFSPLGKRKGTKDSRANVFMTALRWVIHLIALHSLKCVLLENVKGVLQELNGEAPFFHRVTNMLNTLIPEFNWGVDVLRSASYLMPSSRERVILRGLHKVYCPGSLPPCLPAFGVGVLKDFLASGLPNVEDHTLTRKLRQNLAWYEQDIARALSAGDTKPQDVCVLTLDRASGKAYRNSWKANMVPTFTTGNRYLFVMLAGEVSKPRPERTLHRYLTMSERFALQGKDPQMAAMLPTSAAACKASGNSYPTGMIVAALAPMLHKMAAYEGGHAPIHQSKTFLTSIGNNGVLLPNGNHAPCDGSVHLCLSLSLSLSLFFCLSLSLSLSLSLFISLSVFIHISTQAERGMYSIHSCASLG
jgi:site-specific DNA-cytosine methylase